MRARRALLYMPGSDWRKIEKAASLEVDAMCMDLEDGVAPEQKEAARAMVARALGDLDFGEKERLVRVNAVGSGLEGDDLAAVLPAAPDGIVLPKASSAEDVGVVNRAIEGAGQEGMALLAQIESALGVVNLKEIAASGGALQALIFGAEDYAADVGAKRSTEADEVLYARSAVVAHAAAFGLQAIDMLWTDYEDQAGLRKLAKQGAGLGYEGMQIIHPDQIEVVQAVFTPSGGEIAQARRVLEGYEAAKAEGRGAFGLDGKMVDMPMVRAAERVLARAGAKK